MNFQELKQQCIQRTLPPTACVEEHERVVNSKNKKELFQILIDNIGWCQENGFLTVEFLDFFGEKLVNNMGVYYKGDIPEIKNKNIVALCCSVNVSVLGNSTVTEMWDNSTVTKMLGNSTVTEMWDNSTVTKMLGNSTVTKMWGNSTVTEMWGNSTVTKMLGNSTVTEMWGNSTVTEMLGNSTVTEMWGNSTVTEMWGNSTVTEMWDNSTVTKMLGNSTVTKMLGNSTVKGYNNNIPKSMESTCVFIDFKNKEIYCNFKVKTHEDSK